MIFFFQKSSTCTCFTSSFLEAAYISGCRGRGLPLYEKILSSFLKWKISDVPLVYILIDFAQVILD
jgi:hypothetical protein